MLFLYFLFFNGRLSTGCFSKSTGLIFTKISGLVDGVRACSTHWVFSISQGTLPWQRSKVEKSAFFLDQSIVCRVAIPKLLQYHNSDFKRLNRMHFSKMCTILVTFCPEIPEFTLLTITSSVAIRQKSAYHAKYLRMFWTYPDLLYRYGRRIGGDDYPDIRLAVAQGTLLWNQLNLGDVRRHCQERHLLFASAFDNGLADRKSAFKRLNGSNAATSCTNLWTSVQ